jgi:mRNA-degrading endonuclease HigB of HigAB toxin-antitoxin module
VKVVAVNHIINAQKKYPNASEYLRGWYHIMCESHFQSLEELQETFGSLDYSNHLYQFPIYNKKLSAKAFIDFPAQVVLIDEIVFND